MIQVRAGVHSDKEELFVLYTGLFRPYVEEILGWDDQWQRDNFREEWSSSQTEVIEVAGERIGYIQTQNREGPQHLYLLTLAIARSYQNQGIGFKVMNRLMKSCAHSRLPIRLNVFPSNEGALRFYLRLGFAEVERTERGTTLGWSDESGDVGFEKSSRGS